MDERKPHAINNLSRISEFLNGRYLFDPSTNSFMTFVRADRVTTLQVWPKECFPEDFYSSIIKQLKLTRKRNKIQNLEAKPTDEIRFEELKSMGIKLTKMPTNGLEKEYSKLYYRIRQRHKRVEISSNKNSSNSPVLEIINTQ